jgi:hypothetical protein
MNVKDIKVHWGIIKLFIGSVSTFFPPALLSPFRLSKTSQTFDNLVFATGFFARGCQMVFAKPKIPIWVNLVLQ